MGLKIDTFTNKGFVIETKVGDAKYVDTRFSWKDIYPHCDKDGSPMNWDHPLTQYTAFMLMRAHSETLANAVAKDKGTPESEKRQALQSKVESLRKLDVEVSNGGRALSIEERETQAFMIAWLSNASLKVERKAIAKLAALRDVPAIVRLVKESYCKGLDVKAAVADCTKKIAKRVAEYGDTAIAMESAAK